LSPNPIPSQTPEARAITFLTEPPSSTPTISVLNQSIDTNLGKKGEKIFVTNDSYQAWYIMNDKNFHQNLIIITFSGLIKEIL